MFGQTPLSRRKLGPTMTLVGAGGDRCRHREWPLVIGADGSGG